MLGQIFNFYNTLTIVKEELLIPIFILLTKQIFNQYMDINNNNEHFAPDDHFDFLNDELEQLNSDLGERINKDDLKQVKYPQAYILDDTLFDETIDIEND